MKKFQLSIPQPCHESWDQMTPDEKGRFCGSCQKQVIDFSNMTDLQLAAFFKKPMGNVCGRFVQEQLEREITVPTKRIPWLRYFFQFTLPVFLVSLKAVAQKEGRAEKVEAFYTLGGPTLQPAIQEAKSNVLSGKVIDDKGFPIPFASVFIAGTGQGVACDADGKFRLAFQKALPFRLEISAVGFEARAYQVTDTSANEVVLTVSQMILGGEVVVTRAVRKPRKLIPLLSVAKRDTAFNLFSVYPNPARSNGTITIDCKKMAKGVYLLQILAIDGRPLCTKQLELVHEGGLLRTDLPALTASQYVVTLMHTNSKKVYSEKIQVL